MKAVRFKHISADSADIPDGQIFAVYEGEMWAFALRVNDEYSLSSWKDNKASQEEIKKSASQVMYAKKAGWSKTTETRLDDVDWKMKPVFRCLYCGAETLEVEGKCVCRGGKKGALSDFLFPKDW